MTLYELAMTIPRAAIVAAAAINLDTRSVMRHTQIYERWLHLFRTNGGGTCTVAREFKTTPFNVSYAVKQMGEVVTIEGKRYRTYEVASSIMPYITTLRRLCILPKVLLRQLAIFERYQSLQQMPQMDKYAKLAVEFDCSEDNVRRTLAKMQRQAAEVRF